MTPEERAVLAMQTTGVEGDEIEIRCVAEQIRAALAEEREACAGLAERMYPAHRYVDATSTLRIAADTIAAAIRARTP